MNTTELSGRYIALRLESSFPKDIGTTSLKDLKKDSNKRASLSNIILESADKFNLPISVIRRKVSAKFSSAKSKCPPNPVKSFERSKSSSKRLDAKDRKLSKKIAKRLKKSLRTI